MADEVLPKGLRFFNKKENQPDFVVGSLVITMNELFTFCKENPGLLSEYNGQKQLKLQVKKSQNGNLYSSVDTWKPAEQAAGSAKSAPPLDTPVELPGGPLPF